MDIKCPYCGMVYEVDRQEFGRRAECAICGRKFAIGTSAVRNMESGAEASVDRVAVSSQRNVRNQPNRNRVVQESDKSRMGRFRKFLASSPWTVQFSTVYLYVFGIVLAVGALMTSKSPHSLIEALMILAVSGAITLTLPRFNFVRCLLIMWGVFNLIVLLAGSKDFSFLWPFSVSFMVIAVLLVLEPSRRWYRDGPKVNCSPDMDSYKRRCWIAGSLAIIAMLVLFLGYVKERKKIRAGVDYYGSNGSYEPSDFNDLLSSESSSPRSPLSYSDGSENSAEDAIKGALANVRSRYRSALDYYGLTEVHYENNRTVCVLCLSRGNAMPDGQIAYHKEVDLLEWPSFVPKGLAQQLLQDRMLIEQYTKTVGK